MNQTNTPSLGSMLLTFAVGATVGAVVVALTTPKTGSRLRKDLKDLACCGKRRAEDLANPGSESQQRARTPVRNAGGEQRRSWKVSVNDLPG